MDLKVGTQSAATIKIETPTEHTMSTPIQVSSLEQHADAQNVEESYCGSICKVIVDLFNSVVVFFKNLCGCSQQEAPPKIPFEKKVYMSGGIKYSQFFIYGEKKFSMVWDMFLEEMQVSTCEVSQDKSEINFDERFKKEDFLNFVVQHLKDNPAIKLIVQDFKGNNSFYLNLFEGESRLNREPDFVYNHFEYSLSVAVFSLSAVQNVI